MIDRNMFGKRRRGNLKKKVTMALLSALVFMSSASIYIAEASGKSPDIIDISAPNQEGISHNRYENFNVNDNGLVFNNSINGAESVLAGHIEGNSNFTNRNANIILNEVIGNNPSNLNGWIEVGGQRADVIIANSRGINGNNFGFININNAVLTTGTPNIGEDGVLRGFDVLEGNISVGNVNVNSMGDKENLYLLGKTVEVGGRVEANKLLIVAGKNQINTDDRTIVPIGKREENSIAIDVKNVGGMYANQIYLICTGAGTGVNNQGKVLSNDTLRIRTDGQIVNDMEFIASGNVEFEARDGIVNTGIIQSEKDIDLNSQYFSILNKQLGLNNRTGVIASNGNITIIASYQINSTGLIFAGMANNNEMGKKGMLNITGSDINLAGQIKAAEDINIHGLTNISNSSWFKAGNNVNVISNGKFHNSVGGIITAHKNIGIIADELNSDGIIDSGIDYNDGSLADEGNIELKSSNNMILNGSMASAHNINLNSIMNLINRGYVYAQNDLNIEAHNIIHTKTNKEETLNYPTVLVAGGNVVINAKQSPKTDLNTSIRFDGDIYAGAEKVDYEPEPIRSNISINGNEIDLHGNVDARNGFVKIFGKEIDLSLGNIRARGSVDVQADGNINNDGGVILAENVWEDLNGIRLMSRDGYISNVNGILRNQNNVKNLTLSASNGQINNENGKVYGDGMVLFTGNGINNNNGLIISEKNGIYFFKNGLLDNFQGSIISNADMTIYGTGKIRNSGKFVSEGVMTINGNPELYNTGIIAAAHEINAWLSNDTVEVSGMGAPIYFLNGVDQHSPWRWFVYMDELNIPHYLLTTVEIVIPVGKVFVAATDLAIYAVEDGVDGVANSLKHRALGYAFKKIGKVVLDQFE